MCIQYRSSIDELNGHFKIIETLNNIVKNGEMNLSLHIRNSFMNYFISPEGELAWQRNVIS